MLTGAYGCYREHTDMEGNIEPLQLHLLRAMVSFIFLTKNGYTYTWCLYVFYMVYSTTLTEKVDMQSMFMTLKGCQSEENIFE